jgi:predicted KAP-like P-loop ATPase
MAKPEPSTNSTISEINADAEKYTAIFNPDCPIESEGDDFLSRKDFSKHLADALCNWIDKESLVVALNGPWGSGKTSVINLVVKLINDEKIKNDQSTRWYTKVKNWLQKLCKISNEEKKQGSFEFPTIVHFNPWAFSEEGNIQKHFFDQIAKELEIKNESRNDKKIAKEIRYYASFLDLVSPDTKLNQSWIKKLAYIGSIGILGSQIYTYFEFVRNNLNYILPILGLFFLTIIFSKSLLHKVANIFEIRSDYRTKSLSEVKGELQQNLSVRGKKLLVIVDDIDRLDKSEIQQIFKLVRVNANFPNTIYLLAFDREVIEKYLDEPVGISGKDYLGKIIQVRFDIPHVHPAKILKFLSEELDRIIGKLPKSVSDYYNSANSYKDDIFNPGLNDFFKNVRDVRRFANSLEFNISKLHKADAMEVNPIDFIAIEALRVFAPQLYNSLKINKRLLTQYQASYASEQKKEANKKEKENTFYQMLKDGNQNSDSIKILLKRLFPQIESLLESGNFGYGEQMQAEWRTNLRVCTSKNFDSYFTLNPGGNEDGISQHELNKIISSAHTTQDFESNLREFITSERIQDILERMLDLKTARNNSLTNYKKNVIQALFNISDDLPKEPVIMNSFGLNSLLVGIVIELLTQNEDPHENYEIIKAALISSKGFIGAIKTISNLLPSEKKKRLYQLNFSPQDNENLINLGLEKISNYDREQLIEHDDLLYILYRWKKWDEEKSWQDFLRWAEEDKMRYVRLITRLIDGSYDFPSEEVDNLDNKLYSFKCVRELLNPDGVKLKLEELKSDASFYSEHRDFFDKALENLDGKSN